MPWILETYEQDSSKQGSKCMQKILTGALGTILVGYGSNRWSYDELGLLRTLKLKVEIREKLEKKFLMDLVVKTK